MGSFSKLYFTETKLAALLIPDNNYTEELGISKMDKINVQDVDFIKQFLLNIIRIETDILAISKRLPIIHFEQQEYELGKNQNELSSYEEKLNEIKENLSTKRAAKNNYELQQSNWKHYYEKLLDTKGDYSPKPFPEKPSEPILEKPGLFNKKKVMASNAEKTKEYEQLTAEWEANVKEIEEENKRLEALKKAAIEEAEVEAKEMAQSEKQKHLAALEKECTDLEVQIAETEGELDRKKQQLEKAGFVNIWDAEVQSAEETLHALVNAKKVYDDSNIIFGKYRDIVAYATFYEYFETGRCDSLTGPTGAYNMYEAEIRQNMIIAQLSEVITSLEEIKQNQYMIYSVVNDMNHELSRLNTSMKSVVNSLNSIQHDVSNISKNSEVIAYNTEVTAYYSKRNAELTNALGFLIAFN